MNKTSLDDVFKKIEDEFVSQSRMRRDQEMGKNSKILDELAKDKFSLIKDLLILAGTIFGSSIALATGRTVNNYFILGELLLFFSILAGLVMLLNHLKVQEWDYAFFSKMSLTSYLLLNKKKIEKFELEPTEKMVDDYERILKMNQSGFLYQLLKFVPIENWLSIFSITFILGIFLILISMIPQPTFETICSLFRKSQL